MYTRSKFGRSVSTVALLAALTGGLAAFASTAEAAAGPTATLSGGTVTITGTAVRDLINLTIDANRLAVDFGGNGSVDATFARSRFQRVQVTAGNGDDGVSVTGTGAVPVTVNGGGGNDGIGVVGNIGETGATDAATTVNGDAGNDTIIAATPGLVTIQGGAGDDIVDGGGAGVGQETVSLGDGNDLFRSSLNAFIGARNDVVDGGAGQDSLKMEGTFASESLRLSANAGHLIVDHELRDRINADNVEGVSFLGLGGSDESGDAVSVGDLTGTEVTNFTPDFSAAQGSTTSNNSADTLTVQGTAGVDHIKVTGSGRNITVAGLTPIVTPVFLDAQDVLRIDTQAGNDTVDTTGLQRGLVRLLVL